MAAIKSTLSGARRWWLAWRDDLPDHNATNKQWRAEDWISLNGISFRAN